jgi:hypothetical protein
MEIDPELDSPLDQIEEEAEETGTASQELLERFQRFCQTESDKVDRIGRFLTLMESCLIVSDRPSTGLTLAGWG